jgi:hypothetical protein
MLSVRSHFGLYYVLAPEQCRPSHRSRTEKSRSKPNWHPPKRLVGEEETSSATVICDFEASAPDEGKQSFSGEPPQMRRIHDSGLLMFGTETITEPPWPQCLARLNKRSEVARCLDVETPLLMPKRCGIRIWLIPKGRAQRQGQW